MSECRCEAWDPQANNHSEAQHTDCGGSLGNPGSLCGGCDSCLSLQVLYYKRQEKARMNDERPKEHTEW